jgi:hypothetical protein
MNLKKPRLTGYETQNLLSYKTIIFSYSLYSEKLNSGLTNMFCAWLGHEALDC